jgi:hypothetical protein
MGNSLSTKIFRLKPLVIITIVVLAATSYVVASTVHSTYERPTYTIHRVFQTTAEYEAFQAELDAMVGVGGPGSTSVRYGPPVEAVFKVTAPAGFPYGTADYHQNSMVVFPILLCLLVLGTLWGLALQRKARQDGQYTESA